MKKLLFILIPIILAAAVIVRLKLNKETASQKVFLNDTLQPVVVNADTIRAERTPFERTYTGTFEPFRETKISAEIPGRVAQVLVDAGSVVVQGQALIQLDNSLLQLQLQSVEIQIEGLEADVKRYTVLAAADAIQKVQLEKSELGLKSARVQKATLQEQIAKTTIRAPFDGIVTAKLTEAGAFAAPGIPLLQITDIGRLKFTINVPENDLHFFNSGKQFTVYADAIPDRELTGTLTLTGSKSGAGNNFPVQFDVTNTSDRSIKSGMFGKVQVNSATTDSVILIPSSAVSVSAGKNVVYVIQQGKAVQRTISISRYIENSVEVTAGLTRGDIIVTTGFINLRDGTPVSVTDN